MEKIHHSTLSYVFIFLLVTASMASAQGVEIFKGKEGNLIIGGGTTHIPIMTKLSRNIMNYNMKINISIRSGGSSLGIRQVGQGVLDIGNAGRSLKEEELRSYRLISIPFAMDGIAVVVHPDNPVSDLSTQEVRKIFAGEITNWQEVNGIKSSINLFGRDKNSATKSIFWQKLLNKGPISETTRILDSNNTMKIVVCLDKAAIGYMSIGVANPEKVKMIVIDDIYPSQENVGNNTYTVSRRLFVNLPKPPSELAQLFVDYLLGDEGKKAISHHGFIPVEYSYPNR